MSMRERGPGGVVRDGATHTGRAVILIVVAVVVAIVLLHKSSSTKVTTAATTTPVATTTVKGGGSPSSGPSTPTTAPPSPSTTSTPTVPPAQVKVLVLNGDSFTLPLASEFTTKLKASGYETLTPNNASGTVTASAIYVLTAGFAPEARTLATSLGLAPTAVKTAVPTGPPLSSGIKSTGANLVLVVGPDLASKA
jgi:hypothetical protein